METPERYKEDPATGHLYKADPVTGEPLDNELHPVAIEPPVNSNDFVNGYKAGYADGKAGSESKY